MSVFPEIKAGNPVELMLAPMLGVLIHAGAGMAFYQWRGKIYVVEQPRNVFEERRGTDDKF